MTEETPTGDRVHHVLVNRSCGLAEFYFLHGCFVSQLPTLSRNVNQTTFTPRQ